MTTDHPIVLTPGQYQTKIAYRIDPILAECVVIEQPHWQSRTNGEQDGSGVWKSQNPNLITQVPKLRPLSRRR